MTEHRARVLRIERTFDAPVERVFEAWTSEEVLRRWLHGMPGWETRTRSRGATVVKLGCSDVSSAERPNANQRKHNLHDAATVARIRGGASCHPRPRNPETCRRAAELSVELVSSSERPAFAGLSYDGRYWARTSDPQLVDPIATHAVSGDYLPLRHFTTRRARIRSRVSPSTAI